MRVVIIGGTGHVGTYAVPRLVEAGHEVISLSRGRRRPYWPHPAWDAVREIVIDREAEERSGSFGKRVREFGADAVIDMICFTESSARHLVEPLRGYVGMLIHIGTIWVHGHSVEVPTREEQNRLPFGEYGIQKAVIEDLLQDEARRCGFPATVLHPGHITGRGWLPINPAGHLSKDIFEKLATGKEVLLPNLGMETLHHIHADDIARLILRVMAQWSCAVGESYHAVSPAALTLRGYAEAVASWFGKQASLRFLPWDEFKQQVSKDEATLTWDHISRSPNCSMAKAEQLLDFRPRYGSLEAVREAVNWLIEQGEITV